MKELYYIRGNKENPQGVRQALLNKGGSDDLGLYFNTEDRIYYVCKDSEITFANDDTKLGKLIMYFGIELQPVEPEETFEPFDKVIGRFGNKGTWTVSEFSHKKDKFYYCGGAFSFTECHYYEPYMKKYIGTNVPFEEFKKE